ncbi:MAG: hypothetical protein IKL52_04745 [Candidatus Gastranaerophilales bacterium]|nr:hypothetical protein [Candidatus Gastranaerophilales bacterium]
MAQTDLKYFQCDAFAKDLATQASQVVPADIKKEDKDFTIEIIFRFCKMAGDALVKEENSQLNASQASLITQFIGEWIFHKSIDIIRAGIDPKHREGILQKVAFTVFDIAKKAVEKDIPQEQLINLVEAQVKKCFTKALEDLKEKGILTEAATQNALSQSNIDAMAVEQVEEETAQDIAAMSDAKIIKLASLAVLIKNFPSEKLKNVLQKFNKPERDVLIKYLKMPDLEEKLDSKATLRCFEEIKNTLPEVIVVSYDKAYKKLCKIVKNSDKRQILHIINNERPIIKEFVEGCYLNKKKKIPAHIADIVSKYLEENVS